jgi:hypothetical protein
MRFDRLCKLIEMMEDDVYELDKKLDQDENGIIDNTNDTDINSEDDYIEQSIPPKIDPKERFGDILDMQVAIKHIISKNPVSDILLKTKLKMQFGDKFDNNIYDYALKVLTNEDNPIIDEYVTPNGTTRYKLFDRITDEKDFMSDVSEDEEEDIVSDMLSDMGDIKKLNIPDSIIPDDYNDESDVDIYKEPDWYPDTDGDK